MADRSSPDTTRARALAIAESWIGTPYRHQASRKGVGCDCLGLVAGIWRELYGAQLRLPASYSPDWAETATGDPMIEAARRHCLELDCGAMQPGDILVFRWQPHAAAKHLAILAARDRIIHAYEGHAVALSALVPYWRRRIAGAFAFPNP
ncbi:NlpC/P60 family protein [Oricola sp.]|uniref:NlpC/P60 family protein n=1 Tax=Oricola sp. TaxID=1979950 RepID=UPI003BAD4450